MKRPKNEWIKEGLARRGYRQKDLAVAWSSQQASVSRFLGGEELQDPPLSKAVSLANMLGIGLEELARGLGLRGTAVEPSVPAPANTTLPIGTVNMIPTSPGIVRLEVRKDISVAAAQQVIAAIASDKLLKAG